MEIKFKFCGELKCEGRRSFVLFLITFWSIPPPFWCPFVFVNLMYMIRQLTKKLTEIVIGMRPISISIPLNSESKD